MAHKDNFVWRLSIRMSVCLSDSHNFLVVMHSYVSQATHAFLGMLPLCLGPFETNDPSVIQGVVTRNVNISS